MQKTDERLDQLKHWLKQSLKGEAFTLTPVSSDASFRRYFRVSVGKQTYIAMDAPPKRENIAPFVKIAGRLRDIGLNVPVLLNVSNAKGFILMSDLGDQLYLTQLNQNTADHLYDDAIKALIQLQTGLAKEKGFIPNFDAKLLNEEMGLFRDWYLKEHLHVTLSHDQHTIIDKTFAHLTQVALTQPQVCVHRDYHSRNLLVTQQNNPGILDFQDAVYGPITYDLVSLLRDCYIRWPLTQIEKWAHIYFEGIKKTDLCPPDTSFKQFMLWFDAMGLQRHIKVMGIFARLKYRDHKPVYLHDIPRILTYLRDIEARLPTYRSFFALLYELEIMRP